MSRNRTILLQRWHSVVRPPSASSCGVKPERSSSGFGGSVGSPSCGTCRWQKRQRISFPGHSVTLCAASVGMEGKPMVHDEHSCGLW